MSTAQLSSSTYHTLTAPMSASLHYNPCFDDFVCNCSTATIDTTDTKFILDLPIAMSDRSGCEGQRLTVLRPLLNKYFSLGNPINLITLTEGYVNFSNPLSEAHAIKC